VWFLEIRRLVFLAKGSGMTDFNISLLSIRKSPSMSFTNDFPTKIRRDFLIVPISNTRPTYLVILNLITLTIQKTAAIMPLLFNKAIFKVPLTI
jgi:hypothetical protein